MPATTSRRSILVSGIAVAGLALSSKLPAEEAALSHWHPQKRIHLRDGSFSNATPQPSPKHQRV
ncbi:MAG: hypothetical protein U0894_10210 [Pirellulales bacterium]